MNEELKIWITDDEQIGVDEFIKWLAENILKRNYKEKGIQSFKTFIIECLEGGTMKRGELVEKLKDEYGTLYDFHMENL